MSENSKSEQSEAGQEVQRLDAEQIHMDGQVGSRAGFVDRPERFPAHIVVSIRKYRWTSLLSVDATLLDMSIGGVKCRIPAVAKIRVKDKAWFCIQPMDGESPEFRVHAIVKWVSGDGDMVGAEFIGVGEEEKVTIQKLIEHFVRLGRLAQ